MISVIIKGNIETAREAAQQRGIELFEATQLAHNQVGAQVEDECRSSLIYWFCEPEMYGEEGLVDGTLMHHN